MSRIKHYLDTSVVDAAAERVSHIFDVFDRVAVMFSGGKDSLVCLELCVREAGRVGRLPLDVIFLDEELLPDTLIDFVAGFRDREELRVHWLAVPMRNSKFVLGESEQIITFDPGRPHVREAPAWALRLGEGDERVFRQQDMDGFVYEELGFRGQAAFVLGIRAEESLTRYRSVVNKLNENYVSASSYGAVKLCKPIYDWTENDVFKWLHEQGIAWVTDYDGQHLSGMNLRISTPLHGEAAKERLPGLRAFDPEFYQRLLDVWPEVELQERYWHDLDRDKLRGDYGETEAGARRYIAERITDRGKRQQAVKLFRLWRTLHTGDPGAYPWSLLLTALMNGVLHRIPIPLSVERR